MKAGGAAAVKSIAVKPAAATATKTVTSALKVGGAATGRSGGAPAKAAAPPAKAAAPAGADAKAAAKEAAEKKAAEEKAAADKKAAEEQAAVEAAAAAEAAGTGVITLIYDVNKHPLAISKGRTTAEAIDEETALTFAYPNCQIHLTLQPVRGIDWKTVAWDKLEARDAAGNFSGLVAGKEYYCVVVEDGKEKARYEKEQAERGAKALAAFHARAEVAAGGAPVDRQLSIESCSCIEGNACVTPECCQDWAGRFENALRIMEEKKKRKLG